MCQRKSRCEMTDQKSKTSRVTREESESHWSFKNEAFMLLMLTVSSHKEGCIPNLELSSLDPQRL